LDVVIKHFEIGQGDVFMDFNEQDTNDEQFDEYYSNKRDLGKIVKETAKLVGAKAVTGILSEKLEKSV